MIRRILTVAAVLSVGACGGDPAGPDLSSGPMTAIIDGSSFVASFATVGRSGGRVFVNAGSADMRAIGFQFPDDGVPATYSLDVGVLASAGVTRPDGSWIAGGGSGGGTIEITVFEADRLEGTFTFVVVAAAGGSSLDVTDGQFAIDY